MQFKKERDLRLLKAAFLELKYLFSTSPDLYPGLPDHVFSLILYSLDPWANPRVIFGLLKLVQVMKA